AGRRRGLSVSSAERTLRRQDGDDLQRFRIDDQELIADHDILEAAVFRNDGHDLGRQYRDVNGPGNGHADADVEVRMVDTRDVAIADDDTPDLGALVLRELDRSAARTAAGAVLLRLALCLAAILGMILVLAPALL